MARQKNGISTIAAPDVDGLSRVDETFVKPLSETFVWVGYEERAWL